VSLRRRLSGFDVLCIGVNAIVGSGVFSLPDDMHRSMGGWSPLSFALCAALLVPVALCFAELASRSDKTGGPYLYAHQAFGPTAGFVVGWSCWLNSFIAWAANATLFIDLCGVREPVTNKIVVVSTIVLLGAVNFVGVRPGAWIVNAMVVGKLVAIFCFLGVAVLALSPERLGGGLPSGLTGVGNGVYLALFPLQGFEVVPVVAGEAKNPKKAIPWSTMGSLLFATLLFVIVQAALVASYDGLGAASVTPLVDAAWALGPHVGLVVLIGSVLSIGGFTAGSALGSPRYALAIAEHGQLPKPLARVHPRFGTPHVAIAVTTALTAALAIPFDYRQLVGMSNVAVVLQYVSTCLAVLVLRQRAPEGDRGWRIPGGPLVPLIGAVGSAALLAGADRGEALVAIAALAVGIPILWWSRRAQA
jgi:amino acid transporter